ncbi:MAG: metallophosphoesterase [Prevotellaceae bacterium]|jgi:predicted MPP superfamily phosphohydrolase|nr:metallophosphoesterase [Prevotellaceae bacterium]
MKNGSFFIIIFAALLALIAYCSVRGYQIIRPLPLACAYISVFILMFASLITGMMWGACFPPLIGKPLSLFGYSFVVVFVYLLIGFVFTDIFRLLNFGFRFVPPETMFAIRQWIFAGTLLVTATALIVGNYKFKHPKIVDLEITTEKTLQGRPVKMVMASDLHLGVTVDKKRLAKYVALINEQQPDVVVFSGDVVDRDLTPLFEQRMYEELRRIKAPLGVYAVTGNHEYISGNMPKVEEFFEKSGFVLLRDSFCLVGNRFYLIGRDDYSNKQRKKLSDLVAGMDERKLRVLLDHQPNNLSEARQNGVDLQLSGHTHYGQFFPINLIEKKIFELPYGYKKTGATHYYVSSGLGIWGPQYRIGTQSELVVIKL